MKKIFIGAFLVCSIFPSTLFASDAVCDIEKYSVVYINGMLNSKEDADFGRKSLESKLRIYLSGSEDKIQTTVYLAYNPSHAGGAGDTLRVLLQKSADQVQGTLGLDYDAKNMLRDLSLQVNEGKILFVPHSQGNFYANSLYKHIVAHPHGLLHTSLTMYNVASPAEVSAYNATHLLSASDQVIAGLVGSVGFIREPNITFGITDDHPDQLGHNFVDTYLALGNERMMSDIEAQLSILKRDIRKNPNEPCIPSPEVGIYDRIQFVQYSTIDTVAFVVKSSLSLAIKGVAFVASAFVDDNDPAVIANSLQNEYREETITSNESPPLSEEVQKRILATLSPTVVPIKQDEHLDNQIETHIYEERIRLLEELLRTTQEKQKKDDITSKAFVVDKSSSRKKNTERISLPEPYADLSAVASTTVASSTPIESVPDTAEASSSVLSIAPFAVRAIQLPQGGEVAAPGDGNLLITEYYIGKEDERSWVEIMNTHKEKWVDTSSVIVDVDQTPFSFPTTLIPPWSTVILYSTGFAHHKEDAAHLPYAVSRALQPLSRFMEGDVKLFERHVGGDVLLDHMHYGGEYCNSPHSFTRSCERLVMQYPGNAPDYWARSIDISLPSRDDFVSSYGKENHLWKYRIFEGRDILETYTSEIPSIQRNRAVYVSGQITVESGQELKIDYAKEFVLVPQELSLYGSSDNTELVVYGTLRVWMAGNLRAEGSMIPHIVVREGGTIIRDPYSFISVPTLVQGGKMRTNAIDFVQIESGSLYLTNYQDATLREEVTCEMLRASDYSPHWTGGNIFINGINCGHREEKDEFGIWKNYGEHDAFGVLFGEDASECSSLTLNTSGTFSCQDEEVPESEEEIDPDNSGSGTSTPPVEPDTATTTEPIDYLSLGLTEEGCFEGTQAEATTSAQQASTCGNGWAQRPALFPLPEMTVQRIPREGRMQVVEYYIGATGSAPWIKIGNMMGGAYVNMYNTDYLIGEERKPIPVLSIPKRNHIVIVGEGEFDPTVLPAEEVIGGAMSSLLYIDRNGIIGDWNEKTLKVWNSPSPREEIVALEEIVLSKDACSGTVTQYGSCLLDRRALYWNDSYEGVL